MINTTASALTHGERLISRLLRDLPKKEFFSHREPRLMTQHGGSSKPDFIIVSARLGVVVLEVKDWVNLKGGDQQTIHTVKSDGTSMNHKNPILTAEGYAYDLKRRFEERAELWEEYRGRKCLRFPWQVIVALPHISQSVIQQFEKRGIWTPGTVIGKEQLASAAHLQQAIRSLPWTFKLDTPLNLDMLDIIRELINPDLRVEDDGQPIGTLTREQYSLITAPLQTNQPKQMSLLEEDELSNEAMGISENGMVRLVRGVAGSGKTLVLIRRVRHLVEQNPDARILVMSFNVDLADDLKKRINLEHENLDILNFHKVCSRILKTIWQDPLKPYNWLRRREEKAVLEQIGLSAEFVKDEFAWIKEAELQDAESYLQADRKGRGLRLDQTKRQLIYEMFVRFEAHKVEQRQQGKSWFTFDDVPFLALEMLDDHPMKGSYDAILIDEAQDFAPSWMRVTKTLLKPGGSLFICDDPSQSIFCSYSWQQKGIPVIGRTKVLRVPFRSTREISEAAHSLIEADETLSQTEERAEPDFTSYELGSGSLPALIACADREAEIAYIESKVQDLLDAGHAPGSIAILCHDRFCADQWTAFSKQGVYVRHFEKMKGMEFTSVFLPFLAEAFPTPDDSQSVTDMRRKIFTAMTRARYQLIMSYAGTLPKPLHPLLENVWCESLS